MTAVANRPRALGATTGGDARPKARVLVVEDDPSSLDLLSTVLRAEGYVVDGANSGESALNMLAERRHELALLDLQLPQLSGIDVLAKARALELETQIIVMTGFASIDSAVEAMRLGAFDYVTKPLRTPELLLSLERALERARLHREVAALRRQAGDGAPRRFIGDTPPVRHMFDLIERVAPLNATVLVTGETGTGKELVARAIHDLSPRHAQPFVPMQCSALSPTLLESELFGHVKGSFTGATASRRGLFEEAHGGTLFLDEISTIGADTQVKILRVLQERSIQRVGSTESVPTDFRLVGATNVDLAREVAEGNFREDLFYRLNVYPIRVPPLRERRQDIPLLAAAFRTRFARENGVEPPAITEETLVRMMEYDWPGNVRELENFCERALIVYAGRESIQFELPAQTASRTDRQMLTQAQDEFWPLERLEREYTLRVLEHTRGRQSEAAGILGISRRTLYRKLRQYYATAPEG